MRKKEIAIHLLARLGMLSVNNYFKRHTLRVANYHRILGAHKRLDEVSFDDGTYCCDEQTFREQMLFVKSELNPIHLDEFLEALESGKQLPDNSVLITFDDGYADNYEVAFPILEELGLSAVFFLPTHRLQTRRLEWWDQAAFAIKAAPQGSYSLEVPVPLEFELNGSNRYPVVARLLDSIKNADTLDYDRFLDHLYESLQTDPPSVAVQSKEIMTLAQASKMVAAGMVIGAHSHSHRILSHLPVDEQEEELRFCKALLEEGCGQEVVSLAYPVGGSGHYTAETKDAARRLGFKCAFNFQGGLNPMPLEDPYDINRIAVSDQTGVSLNALLAGML